MSQYTLSANITKLSKKYAMADAGYLIYADLRAVGWSKNDAWNVAFQGLGLNWPKAELLREIEKLEALGSVQKRMADVQGIKSSSEQEEITPEELARETSKEKILTDLVRAKRNMKEGTKEWTETTKLIADYNKIKQDEIDTENNTIHYYLPISYPRKCSECLLFKNGQAQICKKKKGDAT